MRVAQDLAFPDHGHPPDLAFEGFHVPPVRPSTVEAIPACACCIAAEGLRRVAILTGVIRAEEAAFEQVAVEVDMD